MRGFNGDSLRRLGSTALRLAGAELVLSVLSVAMPAARTQTSEHAVLQAQVAATNLSIRKDPSDRLGLAPRRDDRRSGHTNRAGRGPSMGTNLKASRQAFDFDRLFIEQMIAHHQMGVMMATMELSISQRHEMRKFTEDMVRVQTKEINRMQHWYRNWQSRNGRPAA